VLNFPSVINAQTGPAGLESLERKAWKAWKAGKPGKLESWKYNSEIIVQLRH